MSTPIITPNSAKAPTAEEKAAFEERRMRFAVIARALGVPQYDNGALPLDMVLLAITDRIQQLERAVVRLTAADGADKNPGDVIPGHPVLDDSEPDDGGSVQ
jgi:hypothetical protein